MATDKTGRWLLSAYYLAGRCAVHPIDENGVAQSPPAEWRATGQGAHCMQTDASNRFAFVPHIGGGNGVNAIFQFLFDENTGKLTPNEPATVPQDGDLGPRHYCFHPSLDVLYFSNEQGCSVTAYNFDPDAGTLSAFQTVSTLPSLWSGRNSCAQIRISPSGTMLFAPNRGHDSIACFLIDQESGNLTRTAIVPSEPVPRALNVDPGREIPLRGGTGLGETRRIRDKRSVGRHRPHRDIRRRVGSLCGFCRWTWLASQQDDESADEAHDGEYDERDEVALPEIEHEPGEQRREYHRYVGRNHVDAEYRAEVLSAEEVADDGCEERHSPAEAGAPQDGEHHRHWKGVGQRQYGHGQRLHEHTHEQDGHFGGSVG